LRAYPVDVVAPFLRELYRRAFAKGSLEQRPGIWTDWRGRCPQIQENLPAHLAERLQAMETARSGCAAMDYFARELVELGYMHQHARRWFASWWVHVENLPWELGADFFFRHLLDADAATNTLSWRAVAGLDPRCDPYVLQRSELEQHCAPEILADTSGLDRIAKGAVDARPVEELADLSVQKMRGVERLGRISGRVGLWLHADDLLLEDSPLANNCAVAIAGFLPKTMLKAISVARAAFETMALEDGLERAEQHFDCEARGGEVEELAPALVAWATENQLTHVLALAPFVGPWADEVKDIRAQLEQAGVRLHLYRRATDTRLFSRVGDGFNAFCRRLQPSSRRRAG
jgi:hypothetical protein